MSLTSFGYFVFLFVLLIVYYSFGRRYQNIVLLISSIFFYASFLNNYLYLFLPLIEVAIVYEGAILIERSTDNKKDVLIITIGILVLILFVFKYAFNVFSLFGNAQKFESIFSFLDLIPVIGISYYTLSAIGYLLEVYWGNLEADKNLIDVALFVLFFPQLISGPITRFRKMKDQFHVQHKLDYENLTNGMRRMLWGYFKKMVISDRFAVIVKEVFRNYTDNNCFGIALAVASYMIQLYTDFSGCMDMVIGTAQLFGISLPENFDSPFLSSSYREFWQRWHITLGGWFKDYVMYPLQLSKWINRLAKKIKNKFGKNAGKKIPVYIAMAVVWLLLGIWHGGTPCYMLSTGIMPCLFLILEDLFEGNRIKGYNFLGMIKTLILVGMCWFVICSGSVSQSIEVFKHCLSSFRKLGSFDFYPKNIDVKDMVIMIFGSLVILFADYLQYNKSSIFAFNDRWPFAIKYIFIASEILLIFCFGVVGKSSFIYFDF